MREMSGGEGSHLFPRPARLLTDMCGTPRERKTGLAGEDGDSFGERHDIAGRDHTNETGAIGHMVVPVISVRVNLDGPM